MKIELKQIEVEETISERIKQFADIKSHTGNPSGYKSIEDLEKNHMLKQSFAKTSWNNIPLPLKELLDKIVQNVVFAEGRECKRKTLVNERFIKVQQTCDKLKERIKLVLQESRAQGVFIHEQINDIEPKCMEEIEKQIAKMSKQQYEVNTKLFKEAEKQLSIFEEIKQKAEEASVEAE